jgi:PAS domain S-box-containing protein
MKGKNTIKEPLLNELKSSKYITSVDDGSTLKNDNSEHEKKIEEQTAELKATSERLKRQITQHIVTEEMLRKSEKKYRVLVENLPQNIFHKDRNSVYVSCNKNYADDLKIKPEQIVGKTDYDFYSKELAEKYRADDKSIMESGTVKTIEEMYVQNGNEVVVQTVKASIKDKEGNVIGILGIFWDITDHKNAEKKLLEYQNQLRALSSQITAIEEQERGKFATYVHDSIGQTLFVIKMKLEMLQKPESLKENKEPLKDILTMIDQLIEYSRTLTSELSPSILHQLGLRAGLEWLAEQTHEREGIIVQFEDDKQSKSLSNDISILLFRAVRELLINITKHAKAQKVKVSIRSDETSVRVCVEDDGIGFNASETISSLSKNNSFGLFSIKERLNYLGGHLEIKSTPGHGTRITLHAPLKGKKES